MNQVLLPLEFLSAGESAVVEDVHGDPAWVGRMAELGVRAGSLLEVVRAGSPCLLQVGGARLCLRGDEGSRILVRPAS